MDEPIPCDECSKPAQHYFHMVWTGPGNMTPTWTKDPDTHLWALCSQHYGDKIPGQWTPLKREGGTISFQPITHEEYSIWRIMTS